MEDLEQAQFEPAAEAQALATRHIVLRPAVAERMRRLMQQRDAAMADIQRQAGEEINKTMLIALEAMGVTGAIQGYDFRTGAVKMAD